MNRTVGASRRLTTTTRETERLAVVSRDGRRVAHDEPRQTTETLDRTRDALNTPLTIVEEFGAVEGARQPSSHRADYLATEGVA